MVAFGQSDTLREAAKHVAAITAMSYEEIMASSEAYELAYRAAVKRCHPDTGCDAEHWHRLQEAKKHLDLHFKAKEPTR